MPDVTEIFILSFSLYCVNVRARPEASVQFPRFHSCSTSFKFQASVSRTSRADNERWRSGVWLNMKKIPPTTHIDTTTSEKCVQFFLVCRTTEDKLSSLCSILMLSNKTIHIWNFHRFSTLNSPSLSWDIAWQKSTFDSATNGANNRIPSPRHSNWLNWHLKDTPENPPKNSSYSPAQYP